MINRSIVIRLVGFGMRGKIGICLWDPSRHRDRVRKLAVCVRHSRGIIFRVRSITGDRMLFF